MRNLKKAFAVVALLGGIYTTSDAQYYYGPPPGPPPPPPPGYRHHERQQQQQSQDDEISHPTGYFGLSIGFATPVGGYANEFGGTNTNTTNSSNVNYPGGYAQTGLNFNIGLAVPVNHSNLGIALQYSSASNPFDISTYTNNVAQYDQSREYDGGDINDAYSTSFIMAGLFLTYPVQRLSIDFKLMGGVALTYIPEVAYSGQEYNSVTTYYDQYSWDIASSNSASFAYGLGVDLRYKFRRASLMLGVDYLGTQAPVHSQEQYTDPNNNQFYNNVSGSIPISVVNAYIGVAYDIR